MSVRISSRTVQIYPGFNEDLGYEDIGVIAPYHAQVVKIRKLLREMSAPGNDGAKKVKVGSVEEFQGQVSSNVNIDQMVQTERGCCGEIGTEGYLYLNGAQLTRPRRVRHPAYAWLRVECPSIQWCVLL